MGLGGGWEGALGRWQEQVWKRLRPGECFYPGDWGGVDKGAALQGQVARGRAASVCLRPRFCLLGQVVAPLLVLGRPAEWPGAILMEAQLREDG